MSIPISAVLITKNAEAFIKICLESITWCDEIIIVDSGSTDSTLSICKEYNCKISHQDFLGFGAQKNFAIQQAKNDWILNLDADEVVTNELKNNIQELLPVDANNTAAFQLLRTLIFFGQKFNYGRENRQPVNRLFNRNLCRFDSAEVHEKLIINGSLQKLNGELLHYSYADLFQYFSKFNEYTSKAVIELNKKKKSRNRLLILLFAPFYFFKFYFIELNFMNGYAGFLWSMISSFYVFIKYNKLYEFNHILDQDKAIRLK
jgi:glycosyltransferase involved in cell wall biosynthesis